MKPLVSVIIPTYNEGKYISITLNSLKKQSFKDFEIIVSDRNSKDNTREIAKKFGARVVTTEKRGIGLGRNLGANIAKSKILVFVDADVKLSKNVLSKIKTKMEEKNVVGGVCEFKPLNGTDFDRFFFKLTGFLSQFTIKMKLSFLFVSAQCMFCDKRLFKSLKGFNEDLQYCEDEDLAKRLRKKGNFVYLKETVYVSLRRHKKFGFIKTTIQYTIPTIFYILTGKIPKKLNLETVR